MENRWTPNRLVCAVSGPLGRFLANTLDRVLAAQGYDRKVIEQGRKVVSQGGAFVLTAMGAPEAALAVVSSAAAHDLNIPDAKVNPVVADAMKGKTVINADVKG